MNVRGQCAAPVAITFQFVNREQLWFVSFTEFYSKMPTIRLYSFLAILQNYFQLETKKCFFGAISLWQQVKVEISYVHSEDNWAMHLASGDIVQKRML